MFRYALFIGAVSIARPAAATMLYLGDIPNGSCNACHLQNNVLDAFGVAVQTQLTASGTISWPGLFLRDTDGDGYSNGEELGDPCGVWTRGATPRFTNGITDPGDANSHPNQGTIGLCSGGSGSAPGSTTRPPSSGNTSGGNSTGTSVAGSSVGGSSAGSGEPSSVGAGSTGDTSSASGATTRRRTPAEQLGCGGNHAAGTPTQNPWALPLLMLGLATRAARRRRRTG